MADNDLTSLDEFLTRSSERFQQAKAQLAADRGDTLPYVTRIPICFHCADEGCDRCDPEPPDYDEEYELSAMENSYERYLGRS